MFYIKNFGHTKYRRGLKIICTINNKQEINK